MRLGLRLKFLIALLTITVLFIIVIAYAYSGLNSLHQIAAQMNLRFFEFGTILDVGTDILSATKPVHFFAVNAGPENEKSFSRDITRAKKKLKLIEKSPILDAAEQKMLKQIEDGLRQAEAKSKPLFALKQQRGNPRVAVLSEQTDIKLHKTIALIDKYKRYENKEISDSMSRAERIYSTRNNYIIAIFVMMIIVVMAMLIINRNIINPIIKISRSVEQFGRGHYNQRLRIRTGDEIESLAEAFNQMAFNLWQEEETAALVQKRLLPQKKLQMEGVKIHARQVQAKIIGGDWYDYFLHGERKVNLLIADASGKGMPGALLSTVAMSVIRSEPKDVPMVEILKKSNQTVERRLGNDNFITLFSALLDLNADRMQYINCGHEPPLIYKPDTERWSLLKCDSGLPLGITSTNFHPGQGTIELKKGLKVIMYTDGLTAVTNRAGKCLELDKIIDILTKNKDMAIKPLLDLTLDEVIHYCRHHLIDDITLMGFEIT